MNTQTRTALATAIASLLALSAHAQDRANGTQDEIIVTATVLERDLSQVPGAISVVGQDDLQLARQQLGLDESLSRVPGLFMQNRYNFAQDLRLSMRGFGARAQFGIRGIKVVVDGIPETLPDGQGAVDSIDIGAASRIEVIRGPSSSMYGNASGGVISVTTESGPEDGFAEARVSAGGLGFQKLQLKAGAAGDRVDYLVSLSDSEIDGWRPQSRAENLQLTSRIGLDLGQGRELLTSFNYTDQPVSDDPGGLRAIDIATNPRIASPLNVQFDAGESLEQTRLGFVYEMPLNDKQWITARNYYIWRDFGNVLPTANLGIVDLQRRFVGGGFSYNLEGVWLDRPNRIVVGFDFDDQDDERKRFANLNGVRGTLGFNQEERVRSRGVFIQDELSLSRNVQLTLGLRSDQVEFDITDQFLTDATGDDSGSLEFDDVSPMAGVVVKIAPSANLYATYSSAFETPTTTELNKPDNSGGFNPNVGPQVARNLEVGARGTLGDRHRYEAALFTIDVDDELIGFEVPGVPGRSYYVNAGESTRDGLELSWVMDATDRIQTTVSYAWSDFTFDRFTDASGNYAGMRIPGTAENVLFGELRYTSPRGWFAIGDVLYVDEQFGDNLNTVVIDAYTVANARFGYDLMAGELAISPFVGINNLADEEYISNVRINAAAPAFRYFEPAPGRNGYAGVTVNWQF